MITTRALNLLKRIAASEDGELVRSVPGGWWVDDHQVNGRDATELIRYVLLHLDYGHREDYEIYSINEEGRNLLSNSNYKPSIIKLIAQQIYNL